MAIKRLRASGYSAIRPHLNNSSHIRILVPSAAEEICKDIIA